MPFQPPIPYADTAAPDESTLDKLNRWGEALNPVVPLVGNGANDPVIDPYAKSAEDTPAKDISTDPQGSLEAAQSIDEAQKIYKQLSDTSTYAKTGGAPKLVGGFNSEPYGGWDLANSLTEHGRKSIEAGGEFAKLQAAEADATAKEMAANRMSLEQAYAQHEQERVAQLQEARQRLAQLNLEADKLASTKIDEGRWMRNPVHILGAIVGGFMAGLGGDPDYSTKLINSSIQRDIDLQQADIQRRRAGLEQKRGLYNEFLQLTKDDQAARILTESKMKDLAAMKVKEVGAQYKSPEILARADTISEALRQQSDSLRMEVLSKLWNSPKAMTDDMIRWYGKDAFRRNVTPENMVQQPAPPPKEMPAGAAGAVAGLAGGLSGGPAGSIAAMSAVPEEGAPAPYGQGLNMRREAAVRRAQDFTDTKKKYIYANPYLSDVVDRLRDERYPVILKNALQKHKGNYQAAKSEADSDWDKYLKEQEKGVSQAMGEYTKVAEGQEQLNQLSRKMDAIKKRLGPEKTRTFMGILGHNSSVGDWWRRTKGELGLSSEEDKAVRELDMLYRQYQTTGAKSVFGVLSDKDTGRLQSFAPDNPTWPEMESAVKSGQRAAQARLLSIKKMGGSPVAEAMFEAQWWAAHNPRSNGRGGQ